MDSDALDSEHADAAAPIIVAIRKLAAEVAALAEAEQAMREELDVMRARFASIEDQLDQME